MTRFRSLFLLLTSLLVGMTALAQDASPQDLADPDGVFIEIDGASLYMIERGPIDGPAVLLLHGFGGSTFSWRDNLDALADAGYRVVAFDRPPYGLADKNPALSYSTETYVSLTAGLMDALGIERATLVGHSAGGGVIAQFAVTHPTRVDALVFVAGAVRVPGDAAMADEADEETENGRGGQSPFAALFAIASRIDPSSPLAALTVRALVTPELLANTVRGNYYDQSLVTPEVIDGYTRQIRVTGWEGAFLKLLTQPTGGAGLDFDAFAALDTPMLLIWGAEDAVVPLGAGQRLADFLGVDLLIYPEVGHLPMEENVAQFNDDLLAFLSTVYTAR